MIPAVGGPMARGLLQAAPPVAGPVLEVACGTGYFSAWLRDALGSESQIVGCDAGRAMLDVAAEKRLPRLYLVEADAHDLPVRSGAFAAAYCSLGMQIFLQPLRAVREMARALRPGGSLAYALPARGTLVEFWRAFAERAEAADLRGQISPDGWSTIERHLKPDDAAERAEHLTRLQAADLAEPRVALYEERLTFRDARDLLTRGGFGHYDQALATISDEPLGPGILADVAATLDTRSDTSGLTVTIRALVASARKR
jgi:SAM-dependent methyltransferase